MKLGSDRRVPRSICTACGKLLDSAACVGEDDMVPNPGDFTVCIGCGHLMVFGEGMILRDPFDDELVELAGDPRVLAIQKARRRL